MPLAFQKIDIALLTLSQGESEKRQVAGSLSACENATFPKDGRIDKRRGYGLVSVQYEVDGSRIAPANLFLNVASAHGELLVIGVDTLYAVVARGGDLGDGGLVARGPTLRGGAEVYHVATAALTVEAV
jgi:hypothetical protein